MIPLDLGETHEATQHGLDAMARSDWCTALAVWHTIARFHPTRSVQSWAWGNAGLCYEEVGDPSAAHTAYRHAACLDPMNAENLGNLGACAAAQRHTAEAEAYFHAALAVKPDLTHVLNGLSACASHRGDALEAIRWADACLRLKPDVAHAHWNRSLALLALGQWEDGWIEHEWRKQLPGQGRTIPQPQSPMWQGEPIAGRTIFVMGEQGFGDNLMWSRMLKGLHDLGVRVWFEVYDPLRRLFAQQPYLAGVVGRGDPFPAHDVQAFILDLPGLLDWTPATDYADHPLLTVRPRPFVVRNTPRVGFAWKGRPEHQNDKNRSLLADVATAMLAALPHVEWVQVSPGDPLDGMTPQRITDFLDAAEVMAGCDAVVSVDTAPLHLAGCLGKPVLGLLPHVPEWRWCRGHRWYPGLTTIRQGAEGDWLGMVPIIEAFTTQTREAAA